jgi:hypothetical protein
MEPDGGRDYHRINGFIFIDLSRIGYRIYMRIQVLYMILPFLPRVACDNNLAARKPVEIPD